MGKTSSHHSNKKTSQHIGYLGDVCLFISFSYFFGTCVLLLCIFFNFPKVLTPKIANGEISRFFKAARERHTAATRCNDRSSRSHAVFQPLGACAFFWGAFVVVFRSEPGGRKWLAFCCTYFKGGSEILPIDSCNLRFSFAGFLRIISHVTMQSVLHGSCQGSML